MIWYLKWLIFINLIFWPPEVIEVWRSNLQDHQWSERGFKMESDYQKTYDLISHMTCFYWFNILTSWGHWSRRSNAFMIIWCQKGSQNGNGTPKIYDLIPNMTHFHWFNILTFSEVIIKETSNWRSDTYFFYQCMTYVVANIWKHD